MKAKEIYRSILDKIIYSLMIIFIFLVAFIGFYKLNLTNWYEIKNPTITKSHLNFLFFLFFLLGIYSVYKVTNLTKLTFIESDTNKESKLKVITTVSEKITLKKLNSDNENILKFIYQKYFLGLTQNVFIFFDNNGYYINVQCSNFGIIDWGTSSKLCRRIRKEIEHEIK